MRNRKTFLYLSCAVLLALVGVVALWAVAKNILKEHVQPSPAEETANKLRVLETRIRLFAGRNGRPPETLREVVGPSGYDQDLLTDGWGNPLRLHVERHDGDSVVSLDSAQRTTPPDRLRAEFRIRRSEASGAFETEWIVEPWCREWQE